MQVDPSLRLHDVLSLREKINREDQGIIAMVVVGIAIVLLIVALSAASLYALMSVAVALRTREIGIRVAGHAAGRGGGVRRARVTRTADSAGGGTQGSALKRGCCRVGEVRSDRVGVAHLAAACTPAKRRAVKHDTAARMDMRGGMLAAMVGRTVRSALWPDTHGEDFGRVAARSSSDRPAANRCCREWMRGGLLVPAAAGASRTLKRGHAWQPGIALDDAGIALSEIAKSAHA